MIFIRLNSIVLPIPNDKIYVDDVFADRFRYQLAMFEWVYWYGYLHPHTHPPTGRRVLVGGWSVQITLSVCQRPAWRVVYTKYLRHAIPRPETWPTHQSRRGLIPGRFHPCTRPPTDICAFGWIVRPDTPVRMSETRVACCLHEIPTTRYPRPEIWPTHQSRRDWFQVG